MIRTAYLVFIFFSLNIIPLLSSEQNLKIGWEVLETKGYAKAEQHFLEAAKHPNSKSRAFAALIYYYALNYDTQRAYVFFDSLIHNEKNPYPYIFSLFNTPFFFIQDDSRNPRILSVLQKCIDQPDAQGILSAGAHQTLAQLWSLRKNLHAADSHYAALNALTMWKMIGPFDNLSGSGFNKIFAPEQELNYSKQYQGKDGLPVEWFLPKDKRRDKWMDYTYCSSDYLGSYYAVCFVKSPTTQKVQLRLGTSGAYKLWLNDAQIGQNEEEWNNDLDSYIHETTLQSGWNKVLLKTCSWENNRNNFMLRIVRDNGKHIPELEYSIDIQPYKQVMTQMPMILPNFAETYFLQLIDNYPDRIENYLFLSSCYLRNDKAEMAELLLHKALAAAPNNVLVLTQLAEAYAQNNKSDEASAIDEALISKDSTALPALLRRFDEKILNKQFDEAEKIISEAGKFEHARKTFATGVLSLLNAKNDPKYFETLYKTWRQFPNEPSILSQMSRRMLQRGQTDSAIMFQQKILDLNYTVDNLYALAELYKTKDDIAEWERINLEMTALLGTAPGFFYTMSLEYYQRNEYAKAKKYIDAALDNVKNNGEFWKSKADIYLAQGNADSAKYYYKTSLIFKPYYPEVREKLRTLEQKPSLNSIFSQYSIDSLRKKAPTSKNFPQDDMIVVLHDIKTAVYPEGGYDIFHEYIARVFTQTGIDQAKELSLELEGTTIEKAVTIKINGSEIPADVSSENSLVFKNLQENDFIYIRWKTSYISSGFFLKHFMDFYSVAEASPVQLFRYSVLTPKDRFFEYKVHNAKPATEKTREAPDEILREWVFENTPAIRYEVAMPESREIEAAIEFSTVPSWSMLSDWYSDATYNKSKITYEIRDKVKELLGSNPITEEETIRRIYEFVTDSIRYSFVSFRQSDFIPKDARTVLLTRIGDCKDVATLGMAMLKEAGISSNYVLVNTEDKMRMDNLPSNDFDHVILLVHAKNGEIYLDMTANNYPPSSLPDSDLDSKSLTIAPHVSAPKQLSREQFSPNEIMHDNTINLLPDRSIHTTFSQTFSGGSSASLRYFFRTVSDQDLEKRMTEFLTPIYPNAKLLSIQKPDLEQLLAPTLTFSAEASVPRYAAAAAGYMMFKIPWSTPLESPEMISYESRKYPIVYDSEFDRVTDEIVVNIPKEFIPVEKKKDISLHCPTAEYSLKWTLKKNTLHIKRTYLIKKRFIPVAEYSDFKDFLHNAAEVDGGALLLKKISKQR